MADSNNAIIPVSGCTHRRSRGAHSSMIHADALGEARRKNSSNHRIPDPSTTCLVDMCRLVIVNNIERYPPQSMGIFDDNEWENIVKLRHVRTSPKSGLGGIDGKGRITPAITDKFLMSVEEHNEHLTNNTVIDTLCWKDCVEFRFKRSGLMRPRTLLLPWPVLVQSIKDTSQQLLLQCTNTGFAEEQQSQQQKQQQQQQVVNVMNDRDITALVGTLTKSPMSVALLHETGVGKTVSKIIKAASKKQQQQEDENDDVDDMIAGRNNNNHRILWSGHIEKLEQLLSHWKDLAAKSGRVEMEQQPAAKKMKLNNLDNRKKPPPGSIGASSPSPLSKGSGRGGGSDGQHEQEQDELKQVKKCLNWKDLFVVLKQREEQLRENQGKRMREIRKNLATDRPKVVKVRPSESKNRKIRSRQWGVSMAPQSKMSRMKVEAAVASSRQKTTPVTAFKSNGNGFGSAVAFATVSKKGNEKSVVASLKGSSSSSSTAARSSHGIQRLSGGKLIKVPNQINAKMGGMPRQFASKFKK